MRKTNTPESSRPRGVSGLDIQSPSRKGLKPGTYRAAMHLELQRDKKPVDFKGLFDTETNTEIEQTVTSSGLEDLSLGEKRALEAVKIILCDTDFKGHETGDSGYSETYKGSFTLPVLRVSLSQYFEAYGLDKKPSGDYSQKQREEALNDLMSLDQARVNFCYVRKTWNGYGKGRRELSDIVTGYQKPLISVLRKYNGLEQEDADKVLSGDVTQVGASELLIQCGVLMIDQADKFYALKYRDLYKQIQAFYPRGKQPKGISNIVDKLFTIDYSPLCMSWEKLANLAELGYLIDQRKRKDAFDKLRHYLDIIKELGYVLDVQYHQEGDRIGQYELHLNPEKCSRYEAKLKKTEKLSLADGKSSNDSKK